MFEVRYGLMSNVPHLINTLAKCGINLQVNKGSGYYTIEYSHHILSYRNFKADKIEKFKLEHLLLINTDQLPKQALDLLKSAIMEVISNDKCNSDCSIT